MIPSLILLAAADVGTCCRKHHPFQLLNPHPNYHLPRGGDSKARTRNLVRPARFCRP